MQPCNCCHVLPSQGGDVIVGAGRVGREGRREGDLGRWQSGESRVLFLPDCIIKPLKQTLSALSCLFSPPLSHFPPVVEAVCVCVGGQLPCPLTGEINETDRKTHSPFFSSCQTRHTYLPQMMCLPVSALTLWSPDPTNIHRPGRCDEDFPLRVADGG